MNENNKPDKSNKRSLHLLTAALAFSAAVLALLLADARSVCFYMSGDREMHIVCGTDYNEPGVYAVTSGRLFGEGRELEVERLGEVDTLSPGSYTLTYTAKNGLSSYSTERHVTVDDGSAADKAPTIILTGPAVCDVIARTQYDDPGYAAYDADGKDITESVRVEGEVIPYRAGEYRLVYSVDGAEAERLVTVHALGVPKGSAPKEKTIYLTFDDGPCAYTAELLDLLKKYDAKASFFVTGQDERYADMIGRAYREGHTVGVHTDCHRYEKIYASEEDFFADFYAAQELIKAQTGSYSRIIRFPGGSSNTVSSFNEGIMTRLCAAMTDLGYKYFDWDVSSGDAGVTASSTKIAQNIIDGCDGRDYAVVLQHDIKAYSVAAVEKVLQWGRANGYTFSALTLESPEVHHKVNN